MSEKSEQQAERAVESLDGEVAVKEENRTVVETPATEDTSTAGKAKDSAVDPLKDTAVDKSVKARRGFPWIGLLNFILILGLIAAAAYYWQLQQNAEAEKRTAIKALEQQIASKVESSQIQSNLRPLESGLAEVTSRIEQLQQHQKDLQASGEKLYELFGRDQNSWQLAEVEYLMRIAQHKLILENDFEGAAITLQAASDRIATTGDIGLLPVRVKISDEIAELKTRRRADLVGMTLKLSQLGQQIRGLMPGFQPQIGTSTEAGNAKSTLQAQEASIEERIRSFLGSLVSVKRDVDSPPTQTEALVINVGEKLEDNLKLTRWSVLERDAFQYQRLMKENVALFQQFYNLDDAANHDFYSQLKALQKAEIKPEKPDINGSLEMLRKIISKRSDAEENKVRGDADNV